jgi:hypothetical protein
LLHHFNNYFWKDPGGRFGKEYTKNEVTENGLKIFINHKGDDFTDIQYHYTLYDKNIKLEEGKNYLLRAKISIDQNDTLKLRVHDWMGNWTSCLTEDNLDLTLEKGENLIDLPFTIVKPCKSTVSLYLGELKHAKQLTVKSIQLYTSFSQ